MTSQICSPSKRRVLSLRPAARLQTVLDEYGTRPWTVLGALGTEDRAAYVPRVLLGSNREVESIRLVEVVEPDDSPFRHSAVALRSAAWGEFSTDSRVTRWPVPLLAHPSTIVAQSRNIVTSAAPAIVLDISGLPKRIFFPLIRAVVEARPTVADFIIAYTVPKSYGDPGQPLSIDHSSFAPLPTFGSDFDTASPKRIVVAVGFQTLGLSPILTTNAVQRVKMDALIPFPSPVRSLGLVRDFLSELKSSNPGNEPRQHAVSPIGLWKAYRFLSSIDFDCAWLLPYGPKPIAASMALAGIRKGWPVFYTQPRAYRPDYSSGIASDGAPICWAYVVRANGNDFF